MKPLAQCPDDILAGLTHVFTDIDDTLTTDGLLPAAAYSAIEQLHQSGVHVVPVTGRPGGWCDMVARFWPVLGVIGENGAFSFRYDREARKMIRTYAQSEKERQTNQAKLTQLRDDILAAVPRAAVSADQAYRISDLAIDFCEDVAPLSKEEIDQIVSIFEAAGAVAKVSSIHVNGWFGEFDKCTMTQKFVGDLGLDPFDQSKARFLFVGDSPNDAPMFAAFDHSVGVANIRAFEDTIDTLPTYVTTANGGEGFAELAERILNARGA